MKTDADLLQFAGRKTVPTLLQNEASECGLACLGMIASYYGNIKDLATLRRTFPVSAKGMTLRSLLSIAEAMDLECRAIRTDMDGLQSLKLPAILHWDLSHFTVLTKVGRNSVEIIDPALGRRKLTISEVSNSFTGVAVELEPKRGFKKTKEVQTLKIGDLWGRLRGVIPSMTQLIVLALIIQSLGLLLPLFNQLLIDEALVRADYDMIIMLAIGFSLLTIVNAIISALQSFVGMYLTTSMSMQMQSGLFRHLVRLPTEYFSKRHIGDIQQRFGSLAPIQQLLTSDFLQILMNIFMLIITTVIIFAYSWKLSLLVIGLVAINLAGTMLLFPKMRALEEEAMNAGAKEQTLFLEILRSVQTIKNFGRETEREAVWKNALANEMNTGIRITRIGIFAGTAESIFFGIGNITVMATGAFFVLNGNFSLGMFIAFISYQGRFVDAANALVGQIFTLRMIGLHLERVADIVHADPEAVDEDKTENVAPVVGKITLEDVSFRYSDKEPYILENINLTIEAGSSIILYGPSGQGKSTLINIITGALKPTSGKVLIDDDPIDVGGVKRLRSSLGIVAQNDTLLSGTVGENISFFDPETSLERIHEAAKKASVYDEIHAMPMGFDTLVGDMGSSLSGGQKQRVLLARAFYNNPKIMVLDEGTANLDEANTSAVMHALTKYPATKIIVSHDVFTRFTIPCDAYELVDRSLVYFDRHADDSDSVESLDGPEQGMDNDYARSV